jgi:integrase
MAHLRARRAKKRYVGSVMVNGKREEKWFPDASRKSRRAAEIWEAKRQEEMAQPTQTPMESLTIQQWLNDYLDDVKRRKMAKKTYSEKRTAFIRFVKHSKIGPDHTVEGIDRFLTKRHLDKLVDLGLSGYSVNKDRKNLGAAWKWGAENFPQWPERQNPFHATRKYQEERSPRYVPSDEDFWKFTDYLDQLACSGDPIAVQDYVMHQVFLHLAARKGEVFRLKRQDLDFDQDRIRLWTRKRRNGQLESDWLPMPSGLRLGLLRWLEFRMKLPIRTDYVFVNVDERAADCEYYLAPFTARRAFMQQVCKRIKIKHFGYHAIRHFTASHLYAKGVSVSIIQAILRHKNPNTTARYLRTLGMEPAIKEALEEGVTRPAEVISLEKKRLGDSMRG